MSLPGGNPETVDGFPVFHLDEAPEDIRNLPVVVFAAPGHCRPILRALDRRGVPRENVLFSYPINSLFRPSPRLALSRALAAKSDQKSSRF
jgi:hypothetical protein